MFEAIRSRLVGAWKDLHARGLPSLFVFEFVVVLLGVFAAQWLAERSSERRAIKEMEEVRAGLDGTFARSLTSVAMWEKAIPCLDARMDDILRASAEQRTLSSDAIQRPRFFNMMEAHLSTEMVNLMGQVHGPETALFYARLVRKTEDLSESIRTIAAEWQQFALVNPDYGEPASADFHSARASAGKIKSELVSMDIAVDNFNYAADWLGIERKPNDLNRVPVPDCETIWREGAMHVDADTERGDVEPFKQATP